MFIIIVKLYALSLRILEHSKMSCVGLLQDGRKSLESETETPMI